MSSARASLNPASAVAASQNAAAAQFASQNRRFVLQKPGSGTTPDVFILATDLSEKFWQKEEVKKCMACNKTEFGFFHFRHRCTACGVLNFCADCCTKSALHNDKKVCTNCVKALTAKNTEAKDDLARRIKLSEDATKQLACIDDTLRTSRNEIVQDEDESFQRLMDLVNEERRNIDAMARHHQQLRLQRQQQEQQQAKNHRRQQSGGATPQMLNIGGPEAAIGTTIFNDVDLGPTMAVDTFERRRTHPVYGVRGGILTIRVPRIRGLATLKPANQVNPYVVVEAGFQRRKSIRADVIPNKGKGSPSRRTLDFALEDTFVFDIADDRTGVTVAVLDDTTIPHVTAFLGIAYLNIRRINVAQDMASNLDLQKIQEASEAAEREMERQIEERQRRSDRKDQQNAALAATTAASTTAGTDQLFPQKSINGKYAASLITSQSQTQQQNLSASGNSSGTFQPYTPDDFTALVESGKQTRLLVDYSGHGLLHHSNVSISWTFHPRRQNFAQSPDNYTENATLMCEQCYARDTPGTCACTEADKVQAEEEHIKKVLRQAGGELHAQEMDQRRRRAHALETGETEQLANPYAGMAIPKLHGARRQKVETCCC